MTSTVALVSHLASSSSVRATPSPPTSGRFSGTFIELLDLLRPKCNRSANLLSCCPVADPWDEALLRLLNLPNLPLEVGDNKGESRVGSPGKLGGSMVSCVEVVVRKNWNSGTSGDRVGPVGDMGVAPSSLILSFFFSKSLSAMVLRKMSCRVEFRAASEGKGYAAGDLTIFKGSLTQ